MKKIAAMLLLFGSVCASAVAQPLELSLNEAIQLALDSGYAVRDAGYDVEMKKKEVYEVMANGFPQINGDVQFQKFLDIPTQLIPAEFLGGDQGEFAEVQFGTEYNLTAGITASQLLFDGTYFVGLQAAKTVVDLSEAAQSKTKYELKLSVAQAYHSVLMAEENLRILDDNIATVADLLEETRALFDEGMNEQQDVDQVELNLNQLVIARDNAERFVTIARQSLNFSMGIDIRREVVLTDDIDKLVSISSDEAYLAREPQITSHPDYVLAETNVAIGELQIKGKKAKYYPSLSLFFDHRQAAQRNQMNFLDSDEMWYPTSILGLSLTVPIWSSFQRKAEVERARIGLEQSKLRLEQVEAGLRMNIERARSEYANALETWQNRKRSLELAERIDRTTKIKYAEGIVGSFELNVSQQQLLNEQSQYIGSALELLDAKRDLDYALNIPNP